MAEQVTEYIATGRRKTSVARVRVKPGVGHVLVNGKPMDEYFQRETLVMLAEQPLREVDAVDKYDIRGRVTSRTRQHHRAGYEPQQANDVFVFHGRHLLRVVVLTQRRPRRVVLAPIPAS